MMDVKDARKIIKDLSEKTFICSEYCIETESGYVITTKERQKYARSKKQTNADRIRNMTDEELAEWLHNICQFENSEHFPMISIYNLDTKCEEEIGDNYKDLIEWLQAEVKEVNT